MALVLLGAFSLGTSLAYLRIDDPRWWANALSYVIGIPVLVGGTMIAVQLVRSRFVQQALIATGLTLSICTAWGFLENFGVAPHIYAYYAAILWFAGLGLGACINKLAAMRGGGE